MPYAEIWVDPADVLEDLSDEHLNAEVERRLKKRAAKSGKPAPDLWSSTGFAEDLRTAFYAHDANRFEALLSRIDNGNLPVRGKALVHA